MSTSDKLIESKTVLRGNRQITIKADAVESLVVRAYLESRLPVLDIELNGHSYYLIPTEDFDERYGGSSD